MDPRTRPRTRLLNDLRTDSEPTQNERSKHMHTINLTETYVVLNDHSATAVRGGEELPMEASRVRYALVQESEI